MDKQETLHCRYLVERYMLDKDQGFIEYLDQRAREELGEALVNKICGDRTYVVRMEKLHIEVESKDRIAYKNSIFIKPMVVCKECTHWAVSMSSTAGRCERHKTYFPPNYYCADSDRKESE